MNNYYKTSGLSPMQTAIKKAGDIATELDKLVLNFDSNNSERCMASQSGAVYKLIRHTDIMFMQYKELRTVYNIAINAQKEVEEFKGKTNSDNAILSVSWQIEFACLRALKVTNCFNMF